MSEPLPKPHNEGEFKPASYTLSKEDIAKNFAVSFETGLSSEESLARIKSYGMNVLEEEKEKSAVIRFLEQYKSYMQIVLIIAAIVSLFIAEYTTFILLILSNNAARLS